MITIDNPSLPLAISEAQTGPLTSPETSSGAVIEEQTKPVTVTRSLADYVAAATSENTRRAYRNDLRAYLAWGATLPSLPQTVAAYLVAHAAELSPVTLSRRLVAIGRAHVILG